ncbi:hypothetical protein [Synechococcus sp. PCC 7502]
MLNQISVGIAYSIWTGVGLVGTNFGSGTFSGIP